MFVAVAQPESLEGWESRTHLVGQIAGRQVLACSGEPTGQSVQLAVDDVEGGLACRACRRLWLQVRPQL